MFDQKIKTEIETATKNILTNNKLVLTAQNGHLTKDLVVRYVKNCLYAVRHTPIHLTKARDVAQVRGLAELSAFMTDKFNEEIGHDAWAMNDLDALGAAQDIALDSDITQANQLLMTWVGDLSTNHPLSYLAYITFVEYFTVLAAPPFLESLEKAGYPRSSLSVIALHEELDKDHVVHDLGVIVDLVDTEDKQLLFMNALQKAAIMINDHLNELAEGA
ncbi:MAG: hypothetical protein RJB66_1317 [Pseudomonadota bacterium]|jgi:pyrroloquinoline quinone (PQQ) biosynthesis protein C